MPHTETFVDGVWYPSVSTITGAQPKPWLDSWREKWGERATRKMEIANAIGTEFHAGIERYLDTNSVGVVFVRDYPSCSLRVVKMLESWIAWAKSVDGAIDAIELKVISKTHTYSGTLDAVGTFEGEPMLYDWKTSARIYSDMDLQLVAYAQAYKEQIGVDIRRGMIVHVSKDKPHFKLTTKTFKLGKRVFSKFLKLREMFDELKQKGDSVDE